MKYPDESSTCPHCKRVAAFDYKHRMRLAPNLDLQPQDRAPSVGVGRSGRSRLHALEVHVCIFTCPGCFRAVVFHEWRVQQPSEGREDVPPRYRHWFVLVYPKAAARDLVGKDVSEIGRQAVPPAVVDLFNEAATIEATGAMRGAAILYRAAVETICDARGIARTAVRANGSERLRTLFERIDDLAEQGVDRDLIVDLHEARLMGNDSVHHGIAYSPEEVADVASLVIDAVRLLFVQPAERAAMRDARQRRREDGKARTGPQRAPASEDTDRSDGAAELRP